jgi:hypothetical protein
MLKDAERNKKKSMMIFEPLITVVSAAAVEPTPFVQVGTVDRD